MFVAYVLLASARDKDDGKAADLLQDYGGMGRAIEVNRYYVAEFDTLEHRSPSLCVFHDESCDGFRLAVMTLKNRVEVQFAQSRACLCAKRNSG